MSQESGERDAELAERLAHEFSDLNTLLRQVIKDQNQNQNTNTQTLHLDAGSKLLWVAVWISTICCVYALGSAARTDDNMQQMRQQHLEDSRKLEADADRLSIILQWAPALRDEVNREMEKRRNK